jgi:hypothetical protein
MSEIKRSKEVVNSELQRVFNVGKVIAKQIDELSGDENAGKRQLLLNDLREATKLEESLNNEFAQLAEQEKKPELERIQAIGEELRAPIVSPTANYMNMGGKGGMGMPTPIYNMPSVEQQQARKRELIGERFNLPPSKGVEAEKLPTSLMGQLETLYDPTSKAQLLTNYFGEGNVRPIDVAGNTEFLITQPDGSVKTTLNKGAAELAGVAAEIPSTAVEIGTFLGTLGTTKSPVAAVGVSSAAGAATGALMDEGLRYAYGLKPDIGGTIARRGTQAVIGAGIGGVTDIAIPTFRASRIGNEFVNEFAKNLERSAENLMVREQKLAAKQGRAVGEVSTPFAAKLAGPQGMETQSQLAGIYPKSNIASSARRTQETLLRLSDDWKTNIPANPNNYADIALQKQEQKKALAQQIASATGRNARLIEGSLDRQTRGALSDTDELGDILFNSIKDAETKITDLKNQEYERLSQIADAGGFKMEAREMLKMLPRIKSSVNAGGSMDQAAVKRIEDDLVRIRDAPVLIADAQSAIRNSKKYLRDLSKEKNINKKISKTRLREIQTEELRTNNQIDNLNKEVEELQSINKPLNFKSFDGFIRRFSDARPDNAVGGTTKDAFGVAISNELSGLRRQIYGGINAKLPNGTLVNLGDEFDKTTLLVQERNAYEKNLLGSVLKEAAGEKSKTPRDIVSAVIKEPATIDRVVKSLRELGQLDPSKAGEADRILGLLQLEYMNNIGIKPSLRGKGARSVDVNENMVKALFGNQADAQLRAISDLNNNLKNIGDLGSSKLTMDDLQKMGKPLSEVERKALAKTIAKRIQAEKEEDALTRSTIFSLAQKGDFKNIDADALSKSILSPSSTIKDTQYAMSQLSKSSLESRNLYKGDFRRELLDAYSGGDPNANVPFRAIFDTKRFMNDYRPSSGNVTTFAKKLQTVLGKEEADFLYDLAATAEANAIADVAKTGSTFRVIGSPQGGTVIVSLKNMVDASRNRFITAMLSSGINSNMVKSALAKSAIPGTANNAYNQMAKQMFLTRTGATALAHQASSDPEFSAELINMAKQFDEKQNLYSE